MRRLATLSLLVLAGAAAAEGPTTAEEDLDTLGYISAAKAAAFRELPPSPNGYPEDILVNMRIKLGGERPLPDTSQAPAHAAPEPPANGH